MTSPQQHPSLDRIRGCLFGAAFGDAMGARTEFVRDLEVIRARFDLSGPTQRPWLVTDDTQMMLAVGHALLDVPSGQPLELAQAISARFVTWYHDPENNRAPGNTCLSACDGLNAGAPWQQASIIGSKGCGANMRVQPVGLLPVARYGQDALFGAAQLQAAITHGHPTGLAASTLTAYAIQHLASGQAPDTLLPALIALTRAERERYRRDYLSVLWERSQDPSPERFIARGWDECAALLKRVQAALDEGAHPDDPCDIGGEGWVAEEALATALVCFLWTPQAPVAAIQRGAVTRGDSDSIACLAGALAGAYHGESAWPRAWYAQVEYHEQLEEISSGLAAL